jgi:hypothetical protein
VTGPPNSIFPFPVLRRPIAGAKQEKGRVDFNTAYPGRRFALPWATAALSFQDAILVHSKSRHLQAERLS